SSSLRSRISTLYARWISSSHVSLLFFFSSRRRHTRCYRDWSSDVCSSDLWVNLPERAAGKDDQSCGFPGSILPSATSAGVDPSRSEERRVGKECRSRASLYC